MFPRTIISLAFISIMTLAAANGALAVEAKHRTSYTVYYGLAEIGKATFDIHVTDNSYKVNGKGGSSGLVSWFAPTTGEVTSRGKRRAQALKPVFHRATVKERRKPEESFTVRFKGNRVSKIDVKTNKKRKQRIAPKYIPVTKKHKRNVLDPVTPLVIPVKRSKKSNARHVCTQNFPIFDGETRYDIRLEYKRTDTLKIKGYEGPAFVCRMRYVPLAGHRKDHRPVREMEKNQNMEFWLAPIGDTNVFTPARIVIGTKYGRFTAESSYFGPIS